MIGSIKKKKKGKEITGQQARQKRSESQISPIGNQYAISVINY